MQFNILQALHFFFFSTISNKQKGLQYHITIFTISNKLIVYNVLIDFFFFFFFFFFYNRQRARGLQLRIIPVLLLLLLFYLYLLI